MRRGLDTLAGRWDCHTSGIPINTSDNNEWSLVDSAVGWSDCPQRHYYNPPQIKLITKIHIIVMSQIPNQQQASTEVSTAGTLPQYSSIN